MNKADQTLTLYDSSVNNEDKFFNHWKFFILGLKSQICWSFLHKILSQLLYLTQNTKLSKELAFNFHSNDPFRPIDFRFDKKTLYSNYACYMYLPQRVRRIHSNNNHSICLGPFDHPPLMTNIDWQVECHMSCRLHCFAH